MTTTTRLLAAATFSLLAFTGSQAAAQSCTADTDCPQSYVCAVSGTSTAPACKGTDCPADAGAPAPVVYKSCRPKDCSTDADCGTGMVCYQEKTTSCSGGGAATSGCAANTKCDAGTIVTIIPETCTTTTRNICAFKWQLPCNADSDCGDAFVCDPTVSGGCATSSRGVSAGPNGTAAGTSDASTSYPPAVDAGTPICPTTTAYPGSCRPKATTCTDDSVCPSGWTCTAIGTPTPVTGGGTSTPVRTDAPAGTPADSVDAGGSSTKICVGPFGAGAPVRGGDLGGGGQTTGSSHEGTGGSTSPGSTGGSGGASTPPSSPGSSATGGTTGNAPASSGSSGGCAIASPRASGSALLLIGLATLGLALARRRTRK
jgi:hypothetical protein